MTVERESANTSQAPSGQSGRRAVLGQPAGLLTLSGLELWERAGYYGLQVILVYYMHYSVSDGGLGLSQQTALGVTGAFGGLVYIAQMLGAWLADRVFAPKKLVAVSAMLLALGHLLLACITTIPGLFTGLTLVVLGTGGLKVNVTSMVGHLYSADSVRRDAGFSLYYIGISFGAFLGPTIAGPLQIGLGFPAAFLAAAVGIAVGLAIYLFGGKTLPAGSMQVANPLPRGGRGAVALAALALAALVVGIATSGFLGLDTIGQAVTLIVAAAAVAYFVVLLTSTKTTERERRNVRRYIPVFLVMLLFWMLLLQLFTTFAVYADTRVDLTLGSIKLPATYISAAEGVFATLAAPLIAIIWTKQGARQPRTHHKIAIGLLLIALSYALFAALSGSRGPVNGLWLVLLGMLVMGIGEVTVVPAAMSITTKLAPSRFPTQMMSLYFLTMAGGSTLSGLIAQLYRPTNEMVFFGALAAMTAACVTGFVVMLRRAADVP